MSENMKKRSLVKDLVVGGAIGIAIGCMLELLFSSLASEGVYAPGVPSFLEHFSDVHVGVLIERVLYAVIGIVSMLGARLFDHQRRSLVLSTVLHVGIIAITVMACGWILGWFTSIAGLLGVFLTFLLVYAAIWLGLYLHERQLARAANEKLRELQ